MKKKLFAMITIAVMLFSTTSAFAVTPADVKGTVYEIAVNALMDKNIIKGYEDGTYRPEQEVTRAEACTMIVAMIGKSSVVSTKQSPFKDIETSWAKQSILTAYELGIVKGMTADTFAPDNKVTAQELMTMVVRSFGYTDITPWPSGYLDKSNAMGLQKNLTGTVWTANANRGLTALIVYNGVQELSKTTTPTDTNKKPTDTSSSSKDNDKKSGKLADYTGRAYGMILDNSKVTDKDGDKVDELEFLIGGETVHVNTNGSAKVPSNYMDGAVYGLKMQSGIVKEIGTVDSNGSNDVGAKRFYEYTKGDFREVEDRSSRVVTLVTGSAIKSSASEITIMRDAIFYLATFSGSSINGYKTGSISDISSGTMIRAYDVTDDSTNNADIVVIVKRSDASKL